MKSLFLSTAASLLLPSLVRASFEMAFDNYEYTTTQPPQYRAYDDTACNHIPPVTGQPKRIISIAMRSTAEGLNTGYNTRPPPAMAFYTSPGAGPHCVPEKLGMVVRYYAGLDTQQVFLSPLGGVTHFMVVEGGSEAVEILDGVAGHGEGVGRVVWDDGGVWRLAGEVEISDAQEGFSSSSSSSSGDDDWVEEEGGSGDDADGGEDRVLDGGNIADSMGFSPPVRVEYINSQSASPAEMRRIEEDISDAPVSEDQIEEEEELTLSEQVDRQERYHTRRIFRLADLQDQQRARAMEIPRTAADRLMVARNDEIDGGNYTPIPQSQRHRSYGELLENGWYIDPEQELRARWQEYMTIAFIRFRERHGLSDFVTPETLTRQQRDLFVDFLRDGTPMFFHETYMRPILNSHAQQQMINNFGPPPAMLQRPQQRDVANMPNAFLQFDQDLEAAMEGDELPPLDNNHRAMQRLRRRRELIQRQNELAGGNPGRNMRINMLRNNVNPRPRVDDFDEIENLGGGNRIMRQRGGGRRAGRNLNGLDGFQQDEIDPLEDEVDAAWRIPEPEGAGEQDIPIPPMNLGAAPLVNRPGLVQWAPPPQPQVNAGLFPWRFALQPPSPSTEAGADAGDEGDLEGVSTPPFGPFDSSGPGSVDSDVAEPDQEDGLSDA
ncbi:hypothetical protein TWF481_006341 [Arthrobotrys musiformis]|uniref:Uncharacterized protein n=1 Tax=Arthrobotrys musiformis TaxID=47236 RepID=A0AAV9WGY5_9PEZI